MKWLVAALVVWAVWWLLRPAAKKPDREADQARALLGVRKSADADAIRTAHRRLIAELHPDRGGAPEDARRINAARDLLLARLNRGG